jgi:hypothetical protein
MREFLNEPVTYSNLLAMYAGVMLGKILFSYLDYRSWKKRNEEYNSENMRQAGYRDN